MSPHIRRLDPLATLTTRPERPDPEATLCAHLEARDEACPDCAYRLSGLPEARCPECGLALRLSMFVGLGRLMEHLRQGVAWGTLRLPFLAAAWGVAWAVMIVSMRLGRPAPGGVPSDPIARLSAGGELFAVTMHLCMGVACLGLGITLLMTQEAWTRERSWRFWAVCASVAGFVHAPALLRFMPPFA